MEDRASVLQDFARFCLPRRLLPFSLRRQRRTTAVGLCRCSSTAALSRCMEGARSAHQALRQVNQFGLEAQCTGTDS
jgi:hypothetical protein